MVRDYKDFLASEVLSDGNLVTYRLVARAMGVHATEAKRQENAKKAGSVHANYLLSGIKQLQSKAHVNGSAPVKGDEDTPMQSSPFPESSMPPEPENTETTVRSLTLVREEDLEEAKSRYIKLTSFHVYSVQPSTIRNLELISDVNEKVFHDYVGEDPLIKGKTWGMIQNPKAQRRSGARPPPPPPEPAPAMKAKKEEKRQSSPPETSAKASVSASEATSSRPAPSKRESSNIFKSFAKSKAKPKQEAENGDDDIKIDAKGPPTDSSARGAHSMPAGNLANETEITQDVHMADDDGEDGDEDIIAPKAGRSSGRKTKAEREEELRRKMFDDDEDEDMPDADTGRELSKEDENEGEEEQEPKSEAEAEPEEDSQRADAKPAKEEPLEKVTVSDSRRRGRRRITKKRMIKDAEGYLVSREETAWESFSEEDVPASKPAKASTAPTAAAKKGAPLKKGQGSIMSFFGKN